MLNILSGFNWIENPTEHSSFVCMKRRTNKPRLFRKNRGTAVIADKLSTQLILLPDSMDFSHFDLIPRYGIRIGADIFCNWIKEISRFFLGSQSIEDQSDFWKEYLLETDSIDHNDSHCISSNEVALPSIRNMISDHAKCPVAPLRRQSDS